MSEEVARMVGAEGTGGVMIDGKRCTARPLTVKELTEVGRECLRQYRKQLLQTRWDSLEVYPEAIREAKYEKIVEEVSKWDVTNLPLKAAYDPSQINITPALLDWLKTNHGDANQKDEKLVKHIVATALDNGLLDPDAYAKLTGNKPIQYKIGYAHWWVTAAIEGQVEMLYAAFKHNDITRDQLMRAITENPELGIELSREIEHLSAPKLGNP
jgi:hypothetical protein